MCCKYYQYICHNNNYKFKDACVQKRNDSFSYHLVMLYTFQRIIMFCSKLNFDQSATLHCLGHLLETQKV